MVPKRIIVALYVVLAAGISAFAQQNTPTSLDYEQRGLDYHRRFAQRIATGCLNGEIAGRTAAEYLRQEKVSLAAGTFESLKQLSADSTASMQLGLVEGKRYMLGFAKNGRHTILTYPADYQLIMGVSLMDMENHLPQNVRNTPLPPVPKDTQADSSQLEHIPGSLIYIKKGASYILDELNSNRYYVYSQTGFDLLLSSDFPVETMANLVTGTDIDAGVEIEILLVKYGFRTETFTVPLRRWVAFCLNEGCTPYFGTISKQERQMVCELVMHNQALGYAHVMKLSFDPTIIDNASPRASARLNSYVPLSNVKSVFYEEQ